MKNQNSKTDLKLIELVDPKINKRSVIGTILFAMGKNSKKTKMEAVNSTIKFKISESGKINNLVTAVLPILIALFVTFVSAVTIIKADNYEKKLSVEDLLLSRESNTNSTISVQVQTTPTPPQALVNDRCSGYEAPEVSSPLRTFYVNADTGNDSNDGLSPSTAWKTLDKTNSSATPGDLFLLRGVFGILPGTDYGQWINPASSGTAQNKIVYKKDPGYSVVIEYGRYDAAIALSEKSHIVVDGLEIRNLDMPILVGEGSGYNWFRNLYVHNAGSSLFRYGANNNRVEDSVFDGIGNPQDNSGDSITVLGDVDNNVFVRNYFGNAGHAAYDDTVQGDSTGFNENNIVAQNIFNNQWATNVIIGGRSVGTLVECNEIKNASQNTPNPSLIYPRPGIQMSSKNSIVRYNIIHHNKSDGIILQGYTFATTQQQFPENNQIYHNTVVSNGRSGIYIAVSDSGYPNAQAYVKNNTIENNLFWGNSGSDGANGKVYDIVADVYSANIPWSASFMDGNIFRYNNISNIPFFIIVRNAANGGNLVYDTPASVQSVNVAWTNNTQTDPLFVNSSTNNYALQTSSPMIDAGRAIAGVTYNGSAPDLGALETGNQSLQTAYPGPSTPTVPAVIEAENYDNGGEGIAYHDLDLGNNGSSYRQDDVDISARSTASNGFMVFNASAGEWLEYTFNTPTAGFYNIDVDYASEFNNGKFHIEVDGVDVTGQMTANSTGNWGNFQTLSKTAVNITAGTHILRLAFDVNSPDSCNCVVANFDKIAITSNTSNVVWQNVQGTISNGGSVQHNGTTYFGKAVSQQTISAGQFVEWTHTDQPDIWTGLAVNGSVTSNTSFQDLPYSYQGDIREYGTYQVDAYANAGDRIRIEISSAGVVSFKKNGQIVYTSQTPVSGSYQLFVMIQQNSGNGINDAVVGNL